jgi:D-glycero-D-manno-heptose 1,7-bisphosphate phosphatase
MNPNTPKNAAPYSLVLLDRDGVINKDNPQSVHSVAEFEILPGVPQAIQRLNKTGKNVALVTNQAVVGRGDISPEILETIHAHMVSELKKEDAFLDHLYICTDTSVLPHNRRKPAPGMLLEAMADFKAAPSTTVMIGDATRDYQAALSAGCSFILVLTGKGEKTLEDAHFDRTQALAICKDLGDAVAWLLG